MLQFKNFNPNIIGANQGIQGLQYGIDQERGVGKFKMPDGKTYTIEILNISQEQTHQLNEGDWETIASKVALILKDKHLLNERQIIIKKDHVELNENSRIAHADTGNQMLNTSQHADALFHHLSTKFPVIPPQILNMENIVNIPVIDNLQNQNEIPVNNNLVENNHNPLVKNIEQDNKIKEEIGENDNKIIDKKEILENLDLNKNEIIDKNIFKELDENKKKITGEIQNEKTNEKEEFDISNYNFIISDDNIIINYDLPVLDPKTQGFDLSSIFNEVKQHENSELIVQFTSNDPNKFPKTFKIDPKNFDFSTNSMILQKQWKSLIKEDYVNMDLFVSTQTSSGNTIPISNQLTLKYHKTDNSVTMIQQPLIPIGQNHNIKKLTIENTRGETESEKIIQKKIDEIPLILKNAETANKVNIKGLKIGSKLLTTVSNSLDTMISKIPTIIKKKVVG